jgi:hypothetical protein|tara:strand:+ start:685 stop:885 length:201 start_codon:yes stop_codon:yes gene_type:complete
MNAADLKIGDIVDLTILREPENTYLVGQVLGVRQDYTYQDRIAILVGGIDLWLTMDDNVEVRLADV